MYRIQYLCPREAPFWQDLTETALLFFRKVAQYPDFRTAQSAANRLLWQYHSARVIDAGGRIVYEV